MDVTQIPMARAYVPPPPPTPKVNAPPPLRPEDLLPYKRPEPLPDTPVPDEARRPPESLKSDLEHLQRMMEELGYRLEYGLYDETEEFYATVTDPRTQKIVKHIPSEEILELHRRMHELVGNLVDERA